MVVNHGITDEPLYLNSNQEVVIQGSNFAEISEGMVRAFLRSYEEFKLEESGWTLKKLDHMEITLSKYILIRGGIFCLYQSV